MGHLHESPLTPTAAVLYEKLQTYLCFRRIFVAIIVRPSVMFWLELYVIGVGSSEWLVEAIQQGSCWVIYLALFCALKPGRSERGLAGLVRVMSAGSTESQS